MHGGIYRCTGIYFFKSAEIVINLSVLIYTILPAFVLSGISTPENSYPKKGAEPPVKENVIKEKNVKIPLYVTVYETISE